MTHTLFLKEEGFTNTNHDTTKAHIYNVRNHEYTHYLVIPGIGHANAAHYARARLPIGDEPGLRLYDVQEMNSVVYEDEDDDER